MRRLILILVMACAAPLLLAQGAHYEGGVLIAPAMVEETIRLRNRAEAIPTLAFTGPDGHTRTLELPPELDGRLGRCVQITHHQGITYAVGFVHVPVPPGKAGSDSLKQTYFQMPRRLYACDAQGRWTLLARLGPDTTHRHSTLLPLGNGRFLYGNPELCWQGDAVGPFGIYRVEDSRLQLERLVDLGLGGPWYQAVPFPAGSEDAKRFGRGPQISEAYREIKGYPEAWQILRLPSGLCFLHKGSRRWFLLDDQANRCLGQGRVGGAGPEEVLAAAVRPDGRVLVATRQGSGEERRKAWTAKPNLHTLLHPEQSLVEQWLEGRATALGRLTLERDMETVTGIWRVLDPTRGFDGEVSPPRKTEIRLHPFGILPVDLVVRPDGNLEIHQDLRFFVYSRRLRYDWLDRLLKPFTHDWRKLEP